MGKVVDLTFRLTDRVTNPLGRINTSLRKASKQWDRAGQDIQRTGKKITGVGTGITKSVTVPLTAMGTAATANFAKVDEKMTLVKSTMGEAKFATADLGEAMEKAAANSVFSMEDASTATLNFARGGWDAEQAAKALAPAMNLAAGEGGNLDVVSQGLMSTMNSFKASVNVCKMV